MEFSHYPALPPLLLDEDLLRVFPEEPCPYLPHRTARLRGFAARRMHPLHYHGLMDRGFRRSGDLFYQPVCRGCRQCVPLRVPVSLFQPSRGQRRAARRNADLQIATGSPRYSAELVELFSRYQSQWHAKPAGSALEIAEYLFQSPVDTVLFTYRDTRRTLLAAGICDVSDVSLSSVYFFFDPACHQRSLGTFGALTEIAYARRLGIPFYYLGYWVEPCGAMAYKAAYRPHEILAGDGVWRPQAS